MKTPPLPTLDDLQTDLGHVVELMDIVSDEVRAMFADQLLGQDMLNRHAALIWVSFDLLKNIAGQIERLQDNVAIRAAMGAAISASNAMGASKK
jgi:hypothetical protein